MSLAQPGKVQGALQILGAISAILVAILALFAYVWSTPVDMHNWTRTLFNGYGVEFDSPTDGAVVNSALTVSGTATLPSDWVLVLLVQSPSELRYYVAGDGAIKVVDGHWQVDEVILGSSDPKQHQADLQHVFKMVAVLLDEQGQRQVEDALTREKDPGWLETLPHSAAKDIRAVTLSS